jgi:hypothetical protein
MFVLAEFLSSQQVSSYFSRLASKVRATADTPDVLDDGLAYEKAASAEADNINLHSLSLTTTWLSVIIFISVACNAYKIIGFTRKSIVVSQHVLQIKSMIILEEFIRFG